MQKALKILVNPQQTGFIKNRYMAENIMKILEVIDHCENKKDSVVLVSFDFHKVFDSVEWTALNKALKVFGFGENFIAMSKILFTKPLATVMNNGYWSDWFEPTRACHQGCCYSPGIFTLLVELLGIGIREKKKIEGIKLDEDNEI